MKRFVYKLIFLVAVLALAGCGSGGDSSLTVPGGGTTGGGTTTPGDTPVDVSAIQVTVASSTIGTGGTTAVTVRLFTASGQLVTDSKTVTFSLNNPTLASVTPSATTSSGTLSVTLTAGSDEGNVTLTASVDGQSAQQTIQISDQTAAATVNVTSNPGSVTVGGTSVVSATVLDSSGDPMADGTTVNFSVNNTSLGTIVPSASIAGGAGVAQATFSAGTTDAGTATITAVSGSVSGTTTVTVSGAAAGSIEFLAATPQIVVIKGAGGVETSLIEFSVKDSNGNPVLGSQTIQMTLSGPNGGEYIGSTPGATTISVGTVNGIASTTLHSGTIPGTATITATVVGTLLSTNSGVIAIGGGVPSEGHFSLSSTVLNLEGGAYDGITADITALIADRYGNYNVLEGTSVSFYSECGAIDRAINLDAEGAGTVTFRTQRPDPYPVVLSPADNSDAKAFDDAIVSNFSTKLGITISNGADSPRAGLCTIVAVVDGEEEFTDADADGGYDLGETFVDTYDDIHLDKDDDPEDIPAGNEVAGYPYDSTFEDLVVDRNLDGTFDGMNTVWDSNKRISQQIKLLFTGVPGISVAEDGAPVTPLFEGGTITIADGENKRIYFSIHDDNFNPPIAGTSFTVTSDVGGISGRIAYTYLDTNGPGAPIFSVNVFDDAPGDADPTEVGTLEFTWSYKGGVYSTSMTLSVE